MRTVTGVAQQSSRSSWSSALSSGCSALSLPWWSLDFCSVLVTSSSSSGDFLQFFLLTAEDSSVWPTPCRWSAVRHLSLSHCFSLRLAMLFDFTCCWVCSFDSSLRAVGYALVTFVPAMWLCSFDSFHPFSPARRSAMLASASSLSITSLSPTLRVDLLCCVFHSKSVLRVPSFTLSSSFSLVRRSEI